MFLHESPWDWDPVRQEMAHSAVLADCGYGANGAFRHGLEQRVLPYAVGIPHDLVSRKRLV